MVVDADWRGEASPYLVVPISEATLGNLAKFPGPSLYGRFGDYRGPIEQRIGVGDTVEVTIYEAAAGGLFSTPMSASPTAGSNSALIPAQIVQRDGAITVPYAGHIDVVGKTTPEVEKIIVERLAGKAIEPQAIVTLSRNVATSVTVGGEVVKGARIALSTRGGRTIRVPFQTLLAKPKENIYARPGDSLTVVRYPLTFTAVGATTRNSVVPFDAVGISLEEAIGKAAGVVDERADPEGVFVFRYEPAEVARGYRGLTPILAANNLVPTVYLINMRDPKSLFLARRFSVHDKDIVYVSNSPFNDLQKLFQIVGTVTGPLIQGAAVAAYIR